MIRSRIDIVILLIALLGCGSQPVSRVNDSSTAGASSSCEAVGAFRLEFEESFSGREKRVALADGMSQDDYTRLLQDLAANAEPGLKRIVREVGVRCASPGIQLSALALAESDSGGIIMDVVAPGTPTKCDRRSMPQGYEFSCSDGTRGIYENESGSVAVSGETQRVQEGMNRYLGELTHAAAVGAANAARYAKAVVYAMNPEEMQTLKDAMHSLQGTAAPRSMSEILSEFKTPPPSYSLSELDFSAYQEHLRRAQALAEVAGSSLLSPSQMAVFNTQYTEKIARLEEAMVRGTQSSMQVVVNEVNSAMAQLAEENLLSPSVGLRRAANQAIVQGFAQDGVIATLGDGEYRRTLSNLSLRTKLSSADPAERAFAAKVRGLLNEGAYQYAMRGKHRLSATVRLLERADLLYHLEQDIAHEYTSRARIILDYETDAPAVAHHKTLTLSTPARKLLGLEGVNAERLEGYLVVRAANYLADYPELEDHPELLLVAVGGLRNSLSERTGGLASVLQDLDNALAAAEFAIGATTGFISTLATLPSRTVDALLSLSNPVDAWRVAINNHDRVWSLIEDKLQSLSMPLDSLSPADYGEFLGTLAAEGAALLAVPGKPSLVSASAREAFEETLVVGHIVSRNGVSSGASLAASGRRVVNSAKKVPGLADDVSDLKKFAEISSKYGRSVEQVGDSLKTGKGLFGNAEQIARDVLNEGQLKNLKRFEEKLPAGSNASTVHKEGANVVFNAEVPGRVPGSKAVYEKVVDNSGTTVSYTKTTYTPEGKIVHIKDKIDGSEIVPE